MKAKPFLVAAPAALALVLAGCGGSTGNTSSDGSSAAPKDCSSADVFCIGLVTDTGKFMYENTGPAAHHMAAELIEAGVDVHAIYRRIFEGVPQGKLELLARGLANVERRARAIAGSDCWHAREVAALEERDRE